MTLLELIQAAKTAKPAVFNKIDDKRAAAIVRTVLAELGKEIQNTEEGKVIVPVFGTFVAKSVKVKKEGVEATRRRVSFIAKKAKPKAAKAAKA